MSVNTGDVLLYDLKDVCVIGGICSQALRSVNTPCMDHIGVPQGGFYILFEHTAINIVGYFLLMECYKNFLVTLQ